MNKFLTIFLSLLFFTSYCKSQNYVDFQWQNPEYGSHSLNEMKWIAENKFIAVGDEGMILLSFDNGLTWINKQLQTQVNLKGIFVKNEFDIYVIGSYTNSNAELYHSSDAGDTWELVYTYASSGLKDIYFLNNDLGYMVGSLGKILRTEDGGSNWDDISNSQISGDLQCVWFVSPDTGYVGKTTGFGMYRTWDGGVTWAQNFGYSQSNCYTMHFLNDTLGYAGAYGNAIFRTTNAGLTWALQSNPQLSQNINSFAFSDSVNAVAIAGSYIYKTTNGTTWSSTFYTGNLRSGAAGPDGTVIIGNITGGIKRSETFGSANSFTELNPTAGISVYRNIKFVNNQTGWVVGDNGHVLRTTNSGDTWTKLDNAPYFDYPYDIAAISASKLIFITNEGKLITTTNSGSSFTESTLEAGNNLKSIEFPTSSDGYVGGEGGKVWKTTNGGTSYTLLSTGYPQDVVDMCFTDASNGVVLDEYSRLLKTSNGGSSFSLMNGSGVGAVKRTFFINENLGYIVNDNGGVHHTEDGGETWISGGQCCIYTPFDMHFANDSTGFIVGSFSNATCDVAYTTDYGLTWQGMSFPYAYAGWGVFGMDSSTVFLTGQNQTIIRSGVGDIVTQIWQTMESDQHQIQVQPNPATDHFFISGAAVIPEWQLFDLTGKLILSGNSRLVNSSVLHAGYYFLRISENKKVTTLPLIIGENK